MVVRQYDVFLISLDPTIGHEIKKTRPCVVISPDEMNSYISTVMIAPLTSRSRDYPTRVAARFQDKDGWIVLDQIRAVDKRRLVKRMGRVRSKTIREIKRVIREMLVD